jgi:hypothetical protein
MVVGEGPGVAVAGTIRVGVGGTVGTLGGVRAGDGDGCGLGVALGASVGKTGSSAALHPAVIKATTSDTSRRLTNAGRQSDRRAWAGPIRRS